LIPLCTASSVEAGQPVLARLSPTSSVILLRLADGTLAAWRNACPHMGIELDWEPHRLLTRNGRHLQCTGHGALFEPDTGRCIRGPCAGDALTALPVRIQNDMVLLEPSPIGPP
jgi:nitrite reductase/ring-hydroxylating ferredoxin subunit